MIDERQQHHWRQPRVLQRLWNADVEAKSILQAHFHDVQVRAREIDFFAKRRCGLAQQRKGRAQINNQIIEHDIGKLRIGVIESLHLCQRVE